MEEISNAELLRRIEKLEKEILELRGVQSGLRDFMWRMQWSASSGTNPYSPHGRK